MNDQLICFVGSSYFLFKVVWTNTRFRLRVGELCSIRLSNHDRECVVVRDVDANGKLDVVLVGELDADPTQWTEEDMYRQKEHKLAVQQTRGEPSEKKVISRDAIRGAMKVADPHCNLDTPCQGLRDLPKFLEGREWDNRGQRFRRQTRLDRCPHAEACYRYLEGKRNQNEGTNKLCF